MKTIITRLSLCLVLLLAIATVARAADDILIADFEGPGYGEWEATGDAFGEDPAGGTLQGQQPVTGFKGKGLVNTFRNRDESTGTLTSPAFPVQRKYITFLIGGGMHDDTCMQLLVDGEVVAARSGQNDERLTPAFFDVADHMGKTARLRIVDRNTGGWGHVNVDHIVLTDTKPDVTTQGFGPQERTFTVRQKYLVIPIKNGAKICRLSLKVDGEEVRRYDTELATDPDDVDWWAFFTIEGYKGKAAEVSANPATEEGFGLVCQADKVPGSENWYTESMRPQLRFSQKVGWNNDPNGMVWHDGKWHLFFQHNPVGVPWGNMTWGHATSTDLVHWEQQPNKLFPKTMAVGDCYSGGATVDKHNTAGWGENTLVAFFTDTGCGESIAYSTDGGDTFTYYEGNPVVKHNGRDPKVIWYAYDAEDQPLNDKAKELGGHWVMAVYDEHRDHGRNTAFHTSTNLKEWALQSHLPDFFECPELFELPVDGEPDNTRWVTYAADGRYVIGSFDGRTFKPAHQGKLFYGNYYAAQTFDNAPDGRRIQIGWVRVDFHGMPFNQTFSFPHRLTLRNTDDGIRMFAEPVKEIASLHSKTHEAKNKTIAPDKPFEIDASGELFHIRATLTVGSANRVGLDIGGERIVYDTKANKLALLGDFRSILHQADLKPIDGKVTIEAIVDRPLLEIIGNDGRVFITRPRGHKGEVDAIQAFAEGGEAKLVDLKIHELKSIWKN